MELNSNPEVPRKLPRLPRRFPKLPRKFPDFPGGQPLSLGSLTPSPDSQKLSLNIRGQKLNTNFFLKLFGHPRDIPAKIPGHPAKKFGFRGFRRTYRTIWPLPLHVEDPHPTPRRYLDQKVWVWAPFLRADFREGDEDSKFSLSRVRRFTESPEPLHCIAFPVEILTKPLIH